jgi:hypothetical protein
MRDFKSALLNLWHWKTADSTGDYSVVAKG